MGLFKQAAAYGLFRRFLDMQRSRRTYRGRAYRGRRGYRGFRGRAQRRGLLRRLFG
jgi:hypothetical protein